MKYRIGMAAKLVGLSEEGLRLYERDGILAPRRKEQGSYRYYERLDITALMRAKAYQRCGFSLREIEGLINSGSLKHILDSYARQERRLEEEILQKQLALDFLREARQRGEELSQSLWRICWAERPGMYRFEYMEGDKLLLRREEYDTLSRWTRLTPFAFHTPRVSWPDLEEGRVRYFSAMGILEGEVDRLGAREVAATGVYWPPCTCLYTVVRIEGERDDDASYLRPLADYVRQKGLKVTGDPVGRGFLSLNKKRGYIRYRELWLPVEMKNGG